MSFQGQLPAGMVMNPAAMTMAHGPGASPQVMGGMNMSPAMMNAGLMANMPGSGPMNPGMMQPHNMVSRDFYFVGEKSSFFMRIRRRRLQRSLTRSIFTIGTSFVRAVWPA
jgi:hypothetical protein